MSATKATLPSPHSEALQQIDAAHTLDPTSHPPSSPPNELHYANRMTHYLHLLQPSPSPALTLAIRAQHFRRWEIPRSSYPPGRLPYLKWRTEQKNQAAKSARQICLDCGIELHEADRVASLIRKEGLKQNDEEAQILEDVACLVFLDEQFEDFEKEWDGTEEKMVGILRKTWGKMSEKGRQEALKLDVGERGRKLLGLALSEGQGKDVEERGDVKKD